MGAMLMIELETVGLFKPLPLVPMPPMPLMLFRRAGAFERVGRHAVLADGRLPREDKASHARASKPLKVRGEVLSPAPLRVCQLLHVIVDLACRDRRVAMPLPPRREEVYERLSSRIALFCLPNPFCGILAP
jgi:hypothetical protein